MKATAHIAPKNTVWWINQRSREDSPNQRQDMLFCLNRIYIRDGQFKGRYLYQLCIGRLQILIG